MKTETLSPELAKAIVAAQRACELLERDGVGDKGKYTTGDAVSAEARRVLNLHGAAWLMIDVELEKPGLEVSDIGQQAYVGDVREVWMIVHENGAALVGEGRMPVVTSRGRPHDKAVGASLTYGAGQILRGALNLVREDKNAIDKRADDADGPAGVVDVQSEASAAVCRERTERIAELAGVAGGPPSVWLGFCTRLKIEPMPDGGPPRAAEITAAEGVRMRAALEGEIRRLEARAREREPGDEPDEVPEDDADELARVERQLGVKAPSRSRSRAEAPA
jgi:hypothetical protein